MFSRRHICTGAAGALLAALLAGAPAATAADRWEKAIEAFERADQVQPPPTNGILFIGSSSIVKWPLRECFPNLPVINRGFGGSQIADSVHYAGRILLPYKPRIVVFYAGDNDIAAGKTPEQVLSDYQAFVAKVHQALPRTRIVYIAIKPSIRRWKLAGQMRRANRLIEAVTARDPLLEFVDVWPAMLGPAGAPRRELFVKDGLHLNRKGYELWTSLVLPYLKK